MISLKKDKFGTKCNNNHQSNLHNFIKTFWEQIDEKIPTDGCILLTKKEDLPSIIDIIYVSDTFNEKEINNNFINNLKLNFSESISKITKDNNFLGYLYLINENYISSQYLIVLSKQTWSLEQQQFVTNYNSLLQQYLDLEYQYQQQKNESKSLETLFYQMGHQLRNPLAEISIIAEIINLSSSENLFKSYARDIQNKVAKLNLDIRKILQTRKSKYTKATNLTNNSLPELNQQQSKQDIRKIFKESIKDLKHLINNKNLKVKFSQKTVFLTIDSFKLKQIFDNLLSNAIYFSPQGETIDCFWQSFQTEMLISICDRGQSLALEEIQNIFLPFYSRRENGQGLGLTIVREIIIELKGNIWIEKIPQYGTKVSFVLPKNS